MADEKQVNIIIHTRYDGDGEINAKKGLNNIEKAAQKTSSGVVTGARNAESGINNLGASIGRVFAAFYAAKSVISFFSSSVTAANENARSVNMLAAAYQNVGYNAQGAMQQAQKFASEMQSLTGIADEAFLDGQRLLANYGVVGAKAQEAIRAAYALSVSQGVSFESSLTQIAKAAAGSTASLSRYGIVLQDGLKSGEKFDAVLSQINERFGASAHATMGDAITKTNALKEAWGDFKEEVGGGLNTGVVPALDLLTKGVQILIQTFRSLSAAWGVTFDNIFTGIEYVKGGFFALATAAVNSLTPIVKVISYLPGVGKDIETAFNGAKDSLAQMRDTTLEQASALADMRTPLSAIWQTEKDITAEQQARLEAQAEEINNRLANETAAQEELTEIVRQGVEERAQIVDEAQQAEQQKEITEELKRQQQVLDNMGLSSSKDLKGWNRDKEASQEGTSDLEIFAGGGSSLANAESAWASVEAEREALNWLYLEKKALIDQEIADQELKNEALTNLETQFDQQKLINDKTQAKARQQVYASMWSAMTSLAGSENKKIAAVGKIAGVAQATISTFTGAAKALELPFPANLAAMATVLAQGFALVGQIQSIKMADGGLVKAVTGGVPAIIGEGGSDEAVLPLNDSTAMRRIGGAIAEESGTTGGVVVNINVQAVGGVEAILEQLTDASRSGVVQALEFANLNYKVGAEQQGLSV